MKSSIKSKLSFGFEIFVISSSEIFSSILEDIIKSILNMKKRYYWLCVTFVYLIINSIIPLYYLFTGDLNKILKDGSYNNETTDFVTYYNSFKFSVYIFFIFLIIFIIREYTHIIKQTKEKLKKREKLKQLDNIIDKYS